MPSTQINSRISAPFIASATLLIVSFLNHVILFKTPSYSYLNATAVKSSLSSNAILVDEATSKMAAPKKSKRKSTKSDKVIMCKLKKIAFLIATFSFCSVFLSSSANAQENVYYYTDSDVKVKSNLADDNHLENLLNKDFFSIFTSEMSILK